MIHRSIPSISSQQLHFTGRNVSITNADGMYARETCYCIISKENKRLFVFWQSVAVLYSTFAICKQIDQNKSNGFNRKQERKLVFVSMWHWTLNIGFCLSIFTWYNEHTYTQSPNYHNKVDNISLFTVTVVYAYQLWCIPFYICTNATLEQFRYLHWLKCELNTKFENVEVEWNYGYMSFEQIDRGLQSVSIAKREQENRLKNGKEDTVSRA